MKTINCEHCGQQVDIETKDEPGDLVELPPTEHEPRRFAIFGTESHWLLHRCDIEGVEIDLSESATIGV